MKGVYVLAALVGLGLGTWVTVIIINGVRTRIKTVNERKRRAIK